MSPTSSTCMLVALVVASTATACGARMKSVAPPALPVEEVAARLPSPFLPVSADTSGLTVEEAATFWRAAEHLNALAGTPVYVARAPVHAVIRADGRDCEVDNATGWADGDVDVLGSFTVCLNLRWMTGAGAWAADRLIAHELLHTLGIGHDEDDAASIMTPNLTARGAMELRPWHLERIRDLSE